MARAPEVSRDSLDAAGQAAYDEIAGSRGKVEGGPFGILLNSPELARRAAHLGAFVRYEAPMPARQRHLIALIASRGTECQYEFSVHARLAREQGIPAEAVAALARGERPSTADLDGLELCVVDFARELAYDHTVSDATFQVLLDHVGMEQVCNIVGAIAYFTFVSFPINAFGMEVRAGHEPELPVRR